MAKEIDLREGMFSIVEDRLMPLGHCAMFVDGKLMYTGRIDNSPNPQTGWFIILNPDDFDEIDEIYRKEMN